MGRVDIGMVIHFSSGIVKSATLPKSARKALLGIETALDRALKDKRSGRSSTLDLTPRQMDQYFRLTRLSPAQVIENEARMLREAEILFADDLTNSEIQVVNAYVACSGCPKTWEGTTADDRAIYARFRFGHLSIRLGNPGDKDPMAGCEGTTVLAASYGDEFSGSMSYETLKELTKGRILWPERLR